MPVLILPCPELLPQRHAAHPGTQLDTLSLPRPAGGRWPFSRPPLERLLLSPGGWSLQGPGGSAAAQGALWELVGASVETMAWGEDGRPELALALNVATFGGGYW